MHTKTPTQLLWYRYKSRPSALFGLALLSLIAFVAIFAPQLSPFPPEAQLANSYLLPPAWQEDGTPQYLLGTDDLGRDLLSRTLFGARIALSSGLIAVGTALTIGFFLGLIAAMGPHIVGFLVLIILDTLSSLPSILLAILLTWFLGAGLDSATIAVSLVLVPVFARTTYNALRTEMNKEYVIAARLDGAGTMRLIRSTLMPNLTIPLIVQSTLSFSTAVLEIAALGFLGLGAQAPTPEWGALIFEAKTYIFDASWTMTIPGLAILLTVLAINLVGDGLTEALEHE